MFEDSAPTMKERTAMRREVTRLLDELAPERTSVRLERVVAPIQQHRTPDGCILQTENAALSVSWHAQTDDQHRSGELQIVLWSGVVSRRGAHPRGGAPAQLIREEVFNPIERPVDDSVWTAQDGTLFTGAALAAHCLTLLDQQTRAAESVTQ